MTYFMRLPEEGALPVPVLVVEDEPLLQRRIKAILGSLGYTDSLVFAGSLAQARACLAAQPPRLALVDVQLPDGSGLELIREIRAGDADVGILVVSAWGTHESILGALRAGATGYVLKERDDVEVSLSIRSVLRGGRRSTRSSHASCCASCPRWRPARLRTRRAAPRSTAASGRSCAWWATACPTARSPNRCCSRAAWWRA